jgi:hypothetical protein
VQGGCAYEHNVEYDNDYNVQEGFVYEHHVDPDNYVQTEFKYADPAASKETSVSIAQRDPTVVESEIRPIVKGKASDFSSPLAEAVQFLPPGGILVGSRDSATRILDQFVVGNKILKDELSEKRDGLMVFHFLRGGKRCVFTLQLQQIAANAVMLSCKLCVGDENAFAQLYESLKLECYKNSSNPEEIYATTNVSIAPKEAESNAKFFADKQNLAWLISVVCAAADHNNSQQLYSLQVLLDFIASEEPEMLALVIECGIVQAAQEAFVFAVNCLGGGGDDSSAMDRGEAPAAETDWYRYQPVNREYANPLEIASFAIAILEKVSTYDNTSLIILADNKTSFRQNLLNICCLPESDLFAVSSEQPQDSPEAVAGAIRRLSNRFLVTNALRIVRNACKLHRFLYDRACAKSNGDTCAASTDAGVVLAEQILLEVFGLARDQQLLAERKVDEENWK